MSTLELRREVREREHRIVRLARSIVVFLHHQPRLAQFGLDLSPLRLFHLECILQRLELGRPAFQRRRQGLDEVSLRNAGVS